MKIQIKNGRVIDPKTKLMPSKMFILPLEKSWPLATNQPTLPQIKPLTPQA